MATFLIRLFTPFLIFKVTACTWRDFDAAVVHPEFMPFPQDLEAVLEEDLSMDTAYPETFDEWLLNGTAREFNSSILLCQSDPYSQGSIFSWSYIPPTSRNWRIEAIFSAGKTKFTYDGAKPEGSPAFGLFVSDRTSLTSSFRNDAVSRMRGLITTFTVWFTNPKLATAFSPQLTESFPAFDGPGHIHHADDICEPLTPEQVDRGVMLIVQNLEEQITTALVWFENGVFHSQICFANESAVGLNDVVESKNITVGLAGLSQGFYTDIRAYSMSFFSLLPPQTTITPDPTTTTEALTTTAETTTAEVTTAPRTTAAVTTVQTTTTEKYQMPFWNDYQIPEPDLPAERAIPNYVAKELLLSCFDFAPNISAPPNDNKPTQVHASFIVDNFLGINDVDETISITATLFLQWVVDTCNSSNTAASLREPERVFVADPKDVWRPVVLFRSAADDVYMKSNSYGDDLVVAIRPTSPKRTINFYWTRIGIYRSKCRLKLTQFPFDHQTCNFTFSLQRTTLLAEFGGTEIEQPDHFSPSSEWVLEPMELPVKDVIKSTAMKTSVSTVTFLMSFSRKPDYFAFNLLAPTLVLILMELGAFLLPPNIPERSTFAVTILLALTVAQSDVLKSVPKSSQRILLSDYILLLQAFSGGCTVYDMGICAFCNLPGLGRRRISCCLFTRRVRVTIARFCDLLAFILAICALATINYYAANVIFGIY